MQHMHDDSVIITHTSTHTQKIAIDWIACEVAVLKLLVKMVSIGLNTSL